MQPSAATTWSPTMTSSVSPALRVEDAIRSSLTRVVITGRPPPNRLPAAGCSSRACSTAASKGARLVAGPEHVLLAVGGNLAVEHRERRTRTGHQEASRREPDSSGAGDSLLRRLDHRLDVAQRRVEVVTLVQAVAVEAT